MPLRRGRGRPRKSAPISQQKRRANIFRSLYPRRPIQARTHIIKRMAQPWFIQNQAGVNVPILSADGFQSAFFGSPVAGQLPATYNVTLSSQFKLECCLDYGDITSLFDRYKIVGVKLKVQYLQNAPTLAIGMSGAVLPTLVWAFDGDDANVPPDVNTVRVKGYAKSKVLNANKPFSIFIKPRLTKEIYNSPVTTGYSSEKACWLDCNSYSLPHFGVKMALLDWVGDGETRNALRVEPTYYLALRDTQ